jgi:hypothetical protein
VRLSLGTQASPDWTTLESEVTAELLALEWRRRESNPRRIPAVGGGADPRFLRRAARPLHLSPRPDAGYSRCRLARDPLIHEPVWFLPRIRQILPLEAERGFPGSDTSL